MYLDEGFCFDRVLGLSSGPGLPDGGGERVFLCREIFYGIIALVFVGLARVILLAIQNQKTSALLKPWEGLRVGEKVSVFAARDINGQEADIRDTYALVIFFNTVCHACRESVPSWQKFYNKYASRGVKVVGVSFEPESKTKRFVRRYRITFTISVVG